MPPSPSLGHSFRGDSRIDSHKRGRSLEHVLSFKEKDDDLALFNELQSRERNNFLLESTDDFDGLLSSKAKLFPDLKLGINIPARGESSDLLNVDGDKNDYEWLLTPPETPLFSSLDDDPPPISLVHNGRARSRPISISRSSTMEKNRSRGSPSPQRLSPSPQSGTGTFSGRASSAPHSNRGPLRSTSPSRRPSPPPVKHSTPPRSVTPTPRRSTTGSPTSMGMSGMRGTSPARTSRGNSASPKVRAWQSNIPGFSLEAPPNLRTSLADRPATYVRGSSPASSKFGRQSMSPTASRSIASSHSKGSIVSSGDDDADSLQSIPSSFSERPMSRKGIGGYPGGRPSAFTKKSTKTFAPSSAPKRSFDSAIRQMDRRSPQNMFRPLLSSVPSSTFHSGKTSIAHQTLISRNSSVTTSSNASSDLATSAALDTAGSEQYHNERATDCVRVTVSDSHDEVFEFDKTDARPEDTEPESHHVTATATDQSDIKDDVIVNGDSNLLICHICGMQYRPDELSENEDKICFECKETQQRVAKEHMYVSEANQLGQSGLENMDVSSEQLVEHKTVDDPSPPISKIINDKEGAGISVLLNRSSSVKGLIAHGRTINSSAISFEDLSYARDLTSSLRSSVGHGSFSASSSIDLNSARHGDTFVRRQSNSKPQSTVSSFSGNSVPVEGPLSNDIRHVVAGERPTSPSDQIVTADNADPSVARAPVTEAFISIGEFDEDRQKGVSELDETTSVAEEGTISENRIVEGDVEEDHPVQCSLSTMSEIEINDSHPSSPGSQIDVVFREGVEDSSAVTVMHDATDVKDASLEYVDSDHADNIVEESTVTMEDREGKMRRSLTLEEATDTILFCNSIIHDLAYKAASMAIEKEKENVEPFERQPGPTVTIPDRKDNPRGFSSSRTPKTQKASRKKRTTTTETDEAKPPLTLTQNDDKSSKSKNEHVVRNVGIPNDGNGMKPPKLESKCNCTIM